MNLYARNESSLLALGFTRETSGEFGGMFTKVISNSGCGELMHRIVAYPVVDVFPYYCLGLVCSIQHDLTEDDIGLGYHDESRAVPIGKMLAELQALRQSSLVFGDTLLTALKNEKEGKVA